VASLCTYGDSFCVSQSFSSLITFAISNNTCRLTIVVIPIFHVGGEKYRLEHDDLILFLSFLLFDLVHWVIFVVGITRAEFGVDLWYLAPTILLMAAVACHGAAYFLCQSPRRSRLLGGSGVDHMLLRIHAPRGYYRSKNTSC
jgi:hypothetical protein